MRRSSPPTANGIRTAASSVIGKRDARFVGVVCVALTALGWGLNWPATKLLVAVCPPLSARGVAGLVAGAVLFGVAFWRDEALAVPRHLWRPLGATSLLNVSAWMGLTTASLLWLPAGQAATLAYTMPVWAILLAWPVLKERPTWRQTCAIILGICGVITLTWDAGFGLALSRAPGIGLALSAAGLFALGTVWSKRVPLPLARFSLIAWQVTLGSLPLLAVGLLVENTHFGALPLGGWIVLAYTAFISMGACYVLWFAAVTRLQTSTAAIGIMLTPVVGVAASSLLLDDSLTLSQATALALVVSGIILSVKD